MSKFKPDIQGRGSKFTPSKRQRLKGKLNPKNQFEKIKGDK
jgi:hypothetical protein